MKALFDYWYFVFKKTETEAAVSKNYTVYTVGYLSVSCHRNHIQFTTYKTLLLSRHHPSSPILGRDNGRARGVNKKLVKYKWADMYMCMLIYYHVQFTSVPVYLIIYVIISTV